MTDTDPKPESSSRMTRRNFLKASLAFTAGLGATGAAGLAYSTTFEPSYVIVPEVTIPISNLPESFEGYRIAQIGDIHVGSWISQAQLQYVVNLINAQSPDLVVITGDYVTHGDVRPLMDRLIQPLSQLSAPDGVISVLGNHDHWTNAGLVREALQTSNIHELRNTSVVLEREAGKLAIAGMDDVWEQQHDLDRTLASLPEADVPAILLVHEPDFADESAASGRFALQVSGHSHGGQVRLPFIGAPILPRYGRKYPIGQYKVRDMIQYTNRGIGMVFPTVRFGCPPEITVFTLTQVI